MMSPANTYPCLTVNLPGGCEATEPDQYYPTGTRNYARVAPADDYQGAFIAEFMQKQGVKSVYILNDREAYGLGVATTTRKAAESLGIEIAGFEAWDPRASSYEALMKKIQGTGADAVFLGGLIDENGAQVIKDKVAVLGPNDGDVKLFAPDGFTTQATIDESGAASARHVHVRRRSADRLLRGSRRRSSPTRSQAGPLAGKAIDPYAIYGAQSAQIVLDAIADVGRLAGRRDRQDVRDGGHGRAARLVQRSTRTATPSTQRAQSLASRCTWRPTSSRRLTTSRRSPRPSPPQARRNGKRQRLDEAGGHCPPASSCLESRDGAAAAALQRVRKSSVIDAIGLSLLGIVLLFLAVKFYEDPTRFLNVAIIGMTNGAVYGLVALGYTLVYGILQLINFAHGDVFALSGLVASTMIVSVLDLDAERACSSSSSGSW